MSTLAVGTIKSISSAAPVFQNTSGTEKGQLAKAWCNWNGTGTIAIRDSFNVSSLSDTGTGQYTVNFSNALSNANYSVAWGGDGGTGSLSDGCQIFTLTTSSFKSHWGSGGSQFDFTDCYFSVFGDGA